MKFLFGRILIVTWFLGIIWVAVRATPIHGEGEENAIYYFPGISNNLPFLSDPALEDYVGQRTDSFIAI